MTTILAPTQLPLSERLRGETREAHESAENSAFMTRLVRGALSRSDLRHLTAQLLVVYTALEDAARSLAGDEVFAQFHDPALERVASLESDLVALADPGEAPAPVLPAAVAYAERIRAIAHDPAALVAHHYTRYLGDLSGGQALGTIFARALGLQPAAPGLSFYHFEGIAKVKPYKDQYRHNLDSAPMSEAQADRAVAESVVAFRLNQAIFEGLDELSLAS